MWILTNTTAYEYLCIAVLNGAARYGEYLGDTVTQWFTYMLQKCPYLILTAFSGVLPLLYIRRRNDAATQLKVTGIHIL